MFESLGAQGFQIEFHSHAKAILAADFGEAVTELEAVLSQTSIPIEELIAGGGGEAKGTQRLRRALAAKQWVKTRFVVEKSINGVQRQSQSHEVDHVRVFPDGSCIALEIEWNNKDPFYDRDLENFKRLHADGAISVGVIVTRGRKLHESLKELVLRFLTDRQIGSFDDLVRWGYRPTVRQRSSIDALVNRHKSPLSFAAAGAQVLVSDKFGEATTHWRKLEDRVERGVGNPCPLLLIGLPPSIIAFDTGPAVAAVPNAEHPILGRPKSSTLPP